MFERGAPRAVPARRILSAFLTVLLLPPGLSGQGEGGEAGGEAAVWNGERALALAARAAAARRHAFADSSLRRFEARAEGHVYFLADFAGERQLVRADQVALEILWQAPDRALQTIVGRRHEKRLPTAIRYHIDHLSVVLENYGERIRLGEGEEVRDVLHPAASRGLEFYDYRLVDSLEIRVPGKETRVYRLRVRPRDPSTPGIVGTLYVDRASGAIARMTFTFTAAAYRDPNLDYIGVDLTSGLWEGRYWLPAEQEVEIRRQVSWLDFPVGGVIRTRFRVEEYRINGPDRFRLAPGSRVTALPPTALERYDGWDSSLWAGPLPSGARSERGLAAVRATARRMVDPGRLAAGGAARLRLPGASGLLRARRAEGLLVGGGGRFAPGPRDELDLWIGWPFAREELEAEAGWTRQLGPVRLRAGGFVNRLSDIGPFGAAAGALATLAFTLDGEDYSDPFFEDGGELEASFGTERRAAVGLRVAEQRSAALAATPLNEADARPVRPIGAGTMVEATGRLRMPLGRALGAGWRLDLGGRAGLDGPGDFGFTRIRFGLEGAGGGGEAPWAWGLRIRGGLAGGELPPQRVFLLGGRGTVPGYPFRGWGGERAIVADVEVSRRLAAPWISGRLLAAAGWAELGRTSVEAAGRLGVGGTDGLRPALGAGIGIFYDLVRVELVRGLDGGEWQVLLSLDRALWPVL